MTIDLEGGKKHARKSDRVERVEVKAEARKPLRPRPGGNVFADRLAVPQEIRNAYPDCEFFWENDEKGKVEARRSRGWEIVHSDMSDGKWEPGEKHTYTGSVIRIPVGRGETTDNLYAVLMMIPRQWYEEDVAEQEKHNRELRNSLRRSKDSQDINPDGTYAPRLGNGKYGYSEQVNATK